jgi:hypothetical protein
MRSWNLRAAVGGVAGDRAGEWARSERDCSDSSVGSVDAEHEIAEPVQRDWDCAYQQLPELPAVRSGQCAGGRAGADACGRSIRAAVGVYRDAGPQPEVHLDAEPREVEAREAAFEPTEEEGPAEGADVLPPIARCVIVRSDCREDAVSTPAPAMATASTAASARMVCRRFISFPPCSSVTERRELSR